MLRCGLMLVGCAFLAGCALPTGELELGQAGDRQLEGPRCTGPDDCALGLACLSEVCVQRCDVDTDCDHDYACYAYHAGGGVCFPPSGGQGPLAGEPGPQPDPGKGEPEPSQGLPCAVDALVATHCRHCHNVEPTFGAPMPLVSLGDLRAHGERSLERAIDVQRPMPPPPNPRMPDVDLDALAAWVSAGMPSGAVCDIPPPVQDPSDIVPDEVEEQCDYTLDATAHGPGNPAAPYQVPLQTDQYVCYTFRVPWQGKVHGLSFRPIVDDARVLHHWLLYSGGEERFVGQVKGCNGQHEGAALVAGWAPGGNDAVMPDDVGMELPDGGGLLTLEIHYHNQAGYTDALDRSGVRICATDDLRTHTAAVHWLGTEGIIGFSRGQDDFTGRCTPQSDQPIHILSSSPHMHRRGSHMRSVVRRRDGSQDILIDEPFDFENQIIYPTPMTILPGDTIETTCTFDNDGSLYTFGQKTEDEMCYNFVTAWPVGGMETGGSLVGARHACMR
jgi:hypothetical protein